MQGIQQLKRLSAQQPRVFLLLAVASWFLLYRTLIPASEALVAVLPVERNSHLGGALQFFFYDTPKVLLLLTGIVFVMGIIHTFISPERTRAMLSGKRLGGAMRWQQRWGLLPRFARVPLYRYSLAFCKQVFHWV